MSLVIRPHIPYQGPIYEGIHEGKKITIKGHIPVGANRFTINLMTGSDLNCDRPLHISVRCKVKSAVRNTLQSNLWGAEERHGNFPFTVGDKFILIITVEKAFYKISVNNQLCWEYTHRIPFLRARTILIDGDVTIQRIEFINNLAPFSGSRPSPDSFSGIFCSITESLVSVAEDVISNLGGDVTSSSNANLSCLFPIKGGIRPGMSIYISGRPTRNPHKFTLCIKKGASSHPPPDIAFHFDVRFYNYSIVRNSRLNDVWYAEETLISHFPFQPDCNFDIIIKIENDVYMITVNGQHFTSFRHRLTSFPNFNVLSIENDVIITSIKYV